jgi:bifunctional enzyme CysN/CysC/sulfate adenylyltransferase subunit 1
MEKSVVFVGHADHGKSTMIGRLVYDSNNIPESRMREVEKLIKEYKRRFEFAYFLDAFEDEMREERTIDTISIRFKSEKDLYVITDVPGHKEFIKNMLTGTSYANLAVLVVSAEEGIQEQTERHTFLLKLLGIKRIIVAINKMDMVSYSKETFHEIEEDVSLYLKRMGFEETKVIPTSAIEGDNIFKKSERMEWYHGPTLVETLDSTKVSSGGKNLRFVVQDVYENGIAPAGKIVVGRVESGTIKKGEKVISLPSGSKSRVKRIVVYEKEFEKELESATKGDCIGLELTGESKRGEVLSKPASQPPVTDHFLAEAVVFDRISKGEQLEIALGTARAKCRIIEIVQRINSQTGELIEENPETLEPDDAGIMTVKLEEPLAMEKFSDVQELGRFMFRKKENVGVGIVLDPKIKEFCAR